MTTKVFTHCPPQKDYYLKVEMAEGEHVDTYYVNPGQLGDFYIYGGRTITISEVPIPVTE